MARREGRTRLHAWVSGRVQGVFYRAFVNGEASRVGLRGMVRNLADGRVEVIAEGDRASLDRLLDRLHHGPSGAQVRGVDVEWEEATGGYRDFRVEYP